MKRTTTNITQSKRPQQHQQPVSVVQVLFVSLHTYDIVLYFCTYVHVHIWSMYISVKTACWNVLFEYGDSHDLIHSQCASVLVFDHIAECVTIILVVWGVLYSQHCHVLACIG